MVNLAATVLLALARRLKRGGVIINEHTLTKAQTTFHVRVLRRWFEFIGLEDLPRRVGQPTRKPFCLLTFDDGKRSHFSETAWELERLAVPAVFYVTTKPLSTGSSLWFDWHKQLVKSLGRCPAGLELAVLKQLPYDLVMERLEAACARCGFKPQDASDDLRPMSWEDARSLYRRGFGIGAHGVTHAILTHETRERAYSEIEESLATVASELAAPCRTFAFPNGNYTIDMAQHALCCGATTVMTTEPTWAEEDADLWRLPRIQLFGEFSRSQIESKIALAAIRGALANPDGSGRRYRFIKRAGALSTGGAVPQTAP